MRGGKALAPAVLVEPFRGQTGGCGNPKQPQNKIPGGNIQIIFESSEMMNKQGGGLSASNERIRFTKAKKTMKTNEILRRMYVQPANLS